MEIAAPAGKITRPLVLYIFGLFSAYAVHTSVVFAVQKMISINRKSKLTCTPLFDVTCSNCLFCNGLKKILMNMCFLLGGCLSILCSKPPIEILHIKYL